MSTEAVWHAMRLRHSPGRPRRGGALCTLDTLTRALPVVPHTPDQGHRGPMQSGQWCICAHSQAGIAIAVCMTAADGHVECQCVGRTWAVVHSLRHDARFRAEPPDHRTGSTLWVLRLVRPPRGHHNHRSSRMPRGGGGGLGTRASPQQPVMVWRVAGAWHSLLWLSVHCAMAALDASNRQHRRKGSSVGDKFSCTNSVRKFVHRLSGFSRDLCKVLSRSIQFSIPQGPPGPVPKRSPPPLPPRPNERHSRMFAPKVLAEVFPKHTSVQNDHHFEPKMGELLTQRAIWQHLWGRWCVVVRIWRPARSTSADVVIWNRKGPQRGYFKDYKVGVNCSLGCAIFLGLFIQFLWPRCLLSSGATLGGVRNQDVRGVDAAKVAHGVCARAHAASTRTPPYVGAAAPPAAEPGMAGPLFTLRPLWSGNGVDTKHL